MYKHPSQRYGIVGQCFANRNGTICKIMQSGTCEGKCAFHKTRKELKEGQNAALLRIASLPAEQRQYIADAYFNGNQPWQKAVRL